MGYLLITNNRLMEEVSMQQVFVNGSALDVLIKTRDYIHLGHSLISSPIGASIRMLLSPVKSIIISSDVQSPNEYSLLQIEAAIEKYQMITDNRGEDTKNSSDYEQVDRELTMAAIDEARKIHGGE